MVWFLGWGILLTFGLMVSSLAAVTFTFLLLTLLLVIALPARWSSKAFLCCCVGIIVAAYCGSIWIYLPKYAEHQRLLARFPEVDLAPRLHYELEASGQSKPAAAIVPAVVGTGRIAELESDYKYAARRLVAIRKILAFQALLEVHENFVLDFIAQPGLGVGRMNAYDVVRESTFDLKSEDPEQCLDPPSLIKQPSSQSNQTIFNSNSASHETAARSTSADNQPSTPFARDDLDVFEKANRQNIVHFATPLSLGAVDSQLKARGFQPHAFREFVQSVDHAGDRSVWWLSRLELVSLLKHQPPAVYVSENLPAMDELQNAATRPTNWFEAAAIEQLRGGKEIVTAIGSNELRMVGAIRAIEACRACHRVSTGSLLGAFSYRFH